MAFATAAAEAGLPIVARLSKPIGVTGRGRAAGGGEAAGPCCTEYAAWGSCGVDPTRGPSDRRPVSQEALPVTGGLDIIGDALFRLADGGGEADATTAAAVATAAAAVGHLELAPRSLAGGEGERLARALMLAQGGTTCATAAAEAAAADVGDRQPPETAAVGLEQPGERIKPGWATVPPATEVDNGVAAGLRGVPGGNDDGGKEEQLMGAGIAVAETVTAEGTAAVRDAGPAEGMGIMGRNTMELGEPWGWPGAVTTDAGPASNLGEGSRRVMGLCPVRDGGSEAHCGLCAADG